MPHSPLVEELPRFEIIRLLARGGLTEVLLARSRRGALVAVKRPVKHLCDEPELTERLRAEARLGERLRHEHVVRFVGPPTNDPGGVMEYEPGHTLRDELRTSGRLEVGRTRSLLGQLCRAVSFLHAHQVFHGAIRPEHLWVTERGRLVLLDLGGVRVGRGGVAEPRPAASCRGYAYCAPERLRGREPDEASDIYGIGAVLYEMICGVPPFAGVGEAGLLRQKALEEPCRPGRFGPVDAELEAVAMGALTRDRRARFASAEELGSMLDDARPRVRTLSEPDAGPRDRKLRVVKRPPVDA